MKLGIQGLSSILVVGLSLALLQVGGCGGGDAEHNVAPVKGKITFKGQPVNGGSISFRPIKVVGAQPGMTGKPAGGEVKQDGTFVMTTYVNSDGAVIGTHEVTFTPISIAAKSYEDNPPPSPYLGHVPSPKEVEVKKGGNDFTFELVPAAAAPVAPAGGP